MSTEVRGAVPPGGGTYHDATGPHPFPAAPSAPGGSMVVPIGILPGAPGPAFLGAQARGGSYDTFATVNTSNTTVGTSEGGSFRRHGSGKPPVQRRGGPSGAGGGSFTSAASRTTRGATHRGGSGGGGRGGGAHGGGSASAANGGGSAAFGGGYNTGPSSAPQAKAGGGHRETNRAAQRGSSDELQGSGGAKTVGGATAATGTTLRAKQLRAEDFSHEEHRDEFVQIDYTPCVTVNPVDMDYPLRVRRQDRDITLFVCITVYNEGPEQLRDTLKGLADNLFDLQTKAGIPWDEMAVCVIVDGRREASEEMLDYMQHDIKVYHPNMVEIQYKNKAVMMHLFEKSVELPKHPTAREYYAPLQMIVAIKELNGGKLNSHLWFFTAFCVQVQPKYVLMLDVGTVPQEGSVNNLIVAMEHNEQIGGVCGEIAVRDPRLFNLFEAAQHFEYKMNHVMDKTMESVFGFCNVLPGAFSAYRWVAIRGQPLSQYFYVEEHPIKELGPFVANMYLAEDRVLCFNLVAKENRSWTCHYESSAVATTDVPSDLLGLLRQRRRWLNGSFFALIYYLRNFMQFATRADHSVLRLVFFSLQFVYQLILLAMNWLAIGSMYLVLVIIVGIGVRQLDDGGDELLYFFTLVYTFITVAQLVTGLGSKPDDVWLVYWLSAASYAIIMAIVMTIGVWLLVIGAFSDLVSATGLISIGGYVVCALLHGESFEMAKTFLQYLLMLPMYVSMMSMYSFANLNDVSWGTKDLHYVHGKQLELLKQDPRALAEEREREAERLKREKAAAEGKLEGDKDGDGKLDEHESKAHRRASGVANLRELAKVVGKGATAANQWDTLAEVVHQAQNSEFDLRKNKAAVIMSTALATQNIGKGRVSIQEAQVKIIDLLEDEEQRVRREVKVEDDENQALKRTFAAFRTRLLGLWLTTNFLFITFFLYFDLAGAFGIGFTVTIAFVLAMRIVGSIVYQVEAVFKHCFHATEDVCESVCPDFCCLDSDSEDEEAVYDPSCFRRVFCWPCDMKKIADKRARHEDFLRQKRELEALEALEAENDDGTASWHTGDGDGSDEEGGARGPGAGPYASGMSGPRDGGTYRAEGGVRFVRRQDGTTLNKTLSGTSGTWGDPFYAQQVHMAQAAAMGMPMTMTPAGMMPMMPGHMGVTPYGMAPMSVGAGAPGPGVVAPPGAGGGPGPGSIGAPATVTGSGSVRTEPRGTGPGAASVAAAAAAAAAAAERGPPVAAGGMGSGSIAIGGPVALPDPHDTASQAGSPTASIRSYDSRASDRSGRSGRSDERRHGRRGRDDAGDREGTAPPTASRSTPPRSSHASADGHRESKGGETSPGGEAGVSTGTFTDTDYDREGTATDEEAPAVPPVAAVESAGLGARPAGVSDSGADAPDLARRLEEEDRMAREGRERSLSFNLAEQAFREDGRAGHLGAGAAADGGGGGGAGAAAGAGAGYGMPRNMSAPGIGMGPAEEMDATDGDSVADDGGMGITVTDPAGQVTTRVKREQMVDLVSALDDGEQLSDMLAPKQFRNSEQRWNTLRNVGRFALTGRKKRTREEVNRDRIEAIRKRAGRF